MAVDTFSFRYSAIESSSFWAVSTPIVVRAVKRNTLSSHFICRGAGISAGSSICPVVAGEQAETMATQLHIKPFHNREYFIFLLFYGNYIYSFFKFPAASSSLCHRMLRCCGSKAQERIAKYAFFLKPSLSANGFFLTARHQPACPLLSVSRLFPRERDLHRPDCT